jgi:2-desacetyl-2-hydroxyethyl bacteriochlorophyllide A dehydrogenase
MKTAVFEGPGKVGIWDLPTPKPQDNQVLVKTKACGVCTWEKRFFSGNGVSEDQYPVRGGHEISGIIAEVGPNTAPDLSPGQHVAVASLTKCGQCYYCRHGMDNQCSRSADLLEEQGPWGPAGLSEYVLVRDYEIYRISENLPFEEASMAEPLACVCRSVQASRVEPADAAIIMGAGTMGILHLKLLSSMGVRCVVIEPDPSRHEIALANGALKCLDSAPSPEAAISTLNEADNSAGEPVYGFRAAFVTAGGPQAVDYAIKSTAKGGFAVIYGAFHPDHTMNLDLNDVHYREIAIIGSYRHDRQSFRKATALLSTRTVDVSDLVSATVPFPDVAQALKTANEGIVNGSNVSKTYRVVVTF